MESKWVVVVVVVVEEKDDSSAGERGGRRWAHAMGEREREGWGGCDGRV